MDLPASFLLLSCSQRKRITPASLPALERYNGPQFQVVRKYLATYPQSQANLDITILSARFGIIASSYHIPDYDQRLTSKQVERLRPNALRALQQYLQGSRYQRCCISLGHDYLEVVPGIETMLPAYCDVTYIRGSQGERLSKLFNWLYHNHLEPGRSSKQTIASGSARLRGVTLQLKPEQVLAQGRAALNDQATDLSEPTTWYVEIDGQKVSIKWLVSQIADLSVRMFSTTDALRVLRALGVEVYRI